MITDFLNKHKLCIDNVAYQGLDCLLTNRIMRCDINWRLPSGIIYALSQDYDLVIRTHENLPYREYIILDKHQLKPISIGITDNLKLDIIGKPGL
jgi:hypothetical protein